MYYYEDRYFPFYMHFSKPSLYGREKMQEQEFMLMKSYYPQAARRIQEKVERECERMDYEGSRLYDEYPDKFMLYHVCKKIKDEIYEEAEGETISEEYLDELIQVILYQEILRRRCRRKRCRGYGYE